MSPQIWGWPRNFEPSPLIQVSSKKMSVHNYNHSFEIYKFNTISYVPTSTFIGFFNDLFWTFKVSIIMYIFLHISQPNIFSIFFSDPNYRILHIILWWTKNISICVVSSLQTAILAGTWRFLCYFEIANMQRCLSSRGHWSVNNQHIALKFYRYAF